MHMNLATAVNHKELECMLSERAYALLQLGQFVLHDCFVCVSDQYRPH